MPIGIASSTSLTGILTPDASTTSSSIRLAGGRESIGVRYPTASLTKGRFCRDPLASEPWADVPMLLGSRVVLSAKSFFTHTTATAMLTSGSGGVFYTRGYGA
jgi:hypothetical protein